MATYLHLFGRPRITRDSQAHDLPFERRNQLLVFLALKRGWVGRGELASLLWPEQAQHLAFTNLRKTLFRLQSQPWASSVEVKGNAVRFDAGSDILDFESALQEGRAGDALHLRTGEFLAGFDDDASEGWTSWLGFERERLRTAWRTAALERLAAAADSPEAVTLSGQLLEADPIDEAALRAHMLALAATGQVPGARRAYLAFVARLEDDFGLAPGGELKALHDSLGSTAVHVRRDASNAASKADDGFVGRSVELRRIASQLERGDCRLLCLIGPGGVGKTRLARRAMAQLAPHYADGAAFVSLEDVGMPAEFGSRLARDLGMQQAGSRPLAQVTKYLQGRQMLVVLDNFEQLLGASASLQQLLDDCPRLQVIVTSRARLGIAAEWSLPVDGLPCPDAEDEDRLEAFDAVRVFVNAARRVEPAFIASVEGRSIIDICRQVDGLPLALELAAAWTRVLSCENIAAELRRGADLLRAVDPSRPARHGSIEMVFEQSWAQLSDMERDGLARLSVFRGGFTAEAAASVALAPLPILGALVDKSLLRKEGARLSLHPMVHQLAAAKLLDEDVRASTEAAHAAYYHRMLAGLERPMQIAERAALAQVDAEFENCRAAWHWASAHGAGAQLAVSCRTLHNFCNIRGRFEDGLGLFRAALEHQAPPLDRASEPVLRSLAGSLEYVLDRYPEAIATSLQALEAARQTRDRATRLRCFKTLASCALRQGRYADANRFYKHALRQMLANGDSRGAAATLDNMALVEKRLGHWELSRDMSMQALEQFRQLQDVGGESLCLNNLGTLLVDHGMVEPGLAYLKAGLELAERHGLVSTKGFLLASLTEGSLKTGDTEGAQAYAERALEVCRTVANRSLEAWVHLMFVRIALVRGDVSAARTELRSTIAVAFALGAPSLQIAAVVCFAEVLAAQEAVDCARHVLGYASAHPIMNDQGTLAEIAQMLRKWGVSAAPPGPCEGWELGSFVQRIAAETPLAYAPLIAALRAPR